MTVLTAYQRGNDPIGVFNLSQADNIQNIFLDTASAKQITIPASAKMAIWRADQPVFYRVDADPVVPTADISSEGSIICPADVWEGDHGLEDFATLRFIRALPVDTTMTVLFYNN